MKNEDMIASSLHGTWSFLSESTADLGYYEGRAYLVMHFMPDPMQALRSCDDDDDDDAFGAKNCSELRNHACSYDPQTGEKECVNTETSTVEWSDGTSGGGGGFERGTTRG
jgi:hypothetical protein